MSGPVRSGLGPPPSLDGLSALIAKEQQSVNVNGRDYSNRHSMMPAIHSNGGSSKPQSPSQPVAASTSSSSLMSPNHPTNLRKQAKTQLDPTFSLKSYIGAANALLDKARSSDAQGQAEQAFVNYLKAADVVANIPKHVDWPKVVQQRGPTYYRYQDFLKNVPDIIQRGHRLEELLRAREDARAQEVQQSLEQQQAQAPYVEKDLEGAVGGTDVSDTPDRSPASLADRLDALRVQPHSSDSLTRMDRSRTTDGDLRGSVPDHAPSTSRLPESIHISTPSDFAASYPTLDEFEQSQQGNADMLRNGSVPSTPKRPLPSAPVASTSASGSSRSPLPRLGWQEISVEELFPMLNPGFDTVEDRERRTTRLVKKTAPRVLMLDVRRWSEWEARRIKNVDCVCIEPNWLSGSIAAEEISTRLRGSGDRHLFESRDTYDVIVICDAVSRSSNDELDSLAGALIDSQEKALHQAPRLLVGGVERWWRKVGDSGVIGHGIPANGDVATPQSKRHGMYVPGPPPPSLTPGGGAGGTVGGYERAGAGFDHPSGPSMPARAYSSSNLNAPSAMPTTPSHAHQPHIPSYHPPSSTSRQSTATFDYPQLAYHSPQHRQSPYFAGHVNGTPPPPPPPAAVGGLNGYSNRTPALLDSSRGHSMDLARRQAVAPPGGTPLASQERQLSYATMAPRAEQTDEVRVGMTGLKNVGNSCYMNSTLQCLSATIPLARFLLDGSYRKAINRVNPLGTQGALAEAFAQLIRVMWSEKYTFVSPVTFREAITRFAPAFRGYDQHDAQEFLAFLLDGLHEDLNYIKQKPAPVEMTAAREEELETLPQQIASVQEWSIYRERNDSLIVDWFQGQFRNKLTCLTCGKTSTTYNAFLYLSLPIPATSGRGAKVTLTQCLDAFTKDEILEKADAWHCPRCKKPRRATKKLTISRLPQILLIHLKRFSFKGPFTDKIETQVSFPTTNLDLTNYMPPPLPPGSAPRGTPTGPFVYDLYAATHHFGSLSGGHYTATVRTQGERGEPQWMYCDDSRITKSDERQIHSPSSYILWWNRKAK